MFRRIVYVVLCSLFITGNAYAGLTSNASPVTVGVNSSITSYAIDDISPGSRNINVTNNDDTAYVWVDVKDATNTSTTSSCFLQSPSSIMVITVQVMPRNATPFFSPDTES